MGQDETSMSDSIVSASAFNLIIGLFLKEEKIFFPSHAKCKVILDICWLKSLFVFLIFKHSQSFRAPFSVLNSPYQNADTTRILEI